MDNTVELDFLKSNIQSVIDNIENKRITTIYEMFDAAKQVFGGNNG